MSDDPTKNKGLDSESELWNAIAAFEKILEAIPADRVSLETLIEAYEKVGDHTRAKEYMVRLADVLVNESDEDASRDLIRKLQGYAADDPVISETIARLEEHRPEKVRAVVFDEAESAKKKVVSIAEEISFAWNLLQAKKITQDEYAAVVQDLSENSTKTLNVPVSTLHVINDRGFSNLSDIVAFASVDGKTPLISLGCFDINPEAVKLISLDVMIKRGAIVFELMGQDGLVAMLNPYDSGLRTNVEDITGRICHFFLCMPEEFDVALEQIRRMKDDAG